MSLCLTALAKVTTSFKPACRALSWLALLRWSEAQTTRAPLVAAAAPMVRLEDTAAARALPVGLAVVLIGLLILVTRRKALSFKCLWLTLHCCRSLAHLRPPLVA